MFRGGPSVVTCRSRVSQKGAKAFEVNCFTSHSDHDQQTCFRGIISIVGRYLNIGTFIQSVEDVEHMSYKMYQGTRVSVAAYTVFDPDLVVPQRYQKRQYQNLSRALLLGAESREISIYFD